MTFKLMRIEWVDSEITIGWHKESAIDDATGVCYTLGLLVRDTLDHVVIAHSYDPGSEEFNGAISIPRVAITSETFLGVVDCG